MERISALKNQISDEENQYLIMTELPHKKIQIQLNNKRRNNALNTMMQRQIKDVVQNPNYKIIIIKSSIQGVFGCGGDVKDLYTYLNQSDKTPFFSYYFTEFQNNYCFYLLNQMNDCGSIVFYDGYTIGGSFLMTCYSKIRICTEKTVIFMPECKNGLVIYTPQFFYNLKNNIGIYLWMTGEQVKGSDCVKYGLADYYIHSSQLKELEQELGESRDIEQCIEICQRYSNEIIQTENKNLKYIENLFQLTDFNSFWSKLYDSSIQTYDTDLQQFAQKCINIINSSSKISVRFNYFLLQKCQEQYDLEEFNLVQIKSAININFLYPDSIEGLRKVVIQKDYQPKWTHNSVMDVSQQELDYIIEADEFIQTQKLRIEYLMSIGRVSMERKQQVIHQQQILSNSNDIITI